MPQNERNVYLAALDYLNNTRGTYTLKAPTSDDLMHRFNCNYRDIENTIKSSGEVTVPAALIEELEMNGFKDTARALRAERVPSIRLFVVRDGLAASLFGIPRYNKAVLARDTIPVYTIPDSQGNLRSYATEYLLKLMLADPGLFGFVMDHEVYEKGATPHRSHKQAWEDRGRLDFFVDEETGINKFLKLYIDRLFAEGDIDGLDRFRAPKSDHQKLVCKYARARKRELLASRKVFLTIKCQDEKLDKCRMDSAMEAGGINLEVLYGEFGNKEIYVYLSNPRYVRGKDCILFFDQVNQPQEVVKLIFAIGLLKDCNARSVTCVLPYDTDKWIIDIVSRFADLKLVTKKEFKERSYGKMSIRNEVKRCLPPVNRVFEGVFDEVLFMPNTEAFRDTDLLSGVSIQISEKGKVVLPAGLNKNKSYVLVCATDASTGIVNLFKVLSELKKKDISPALFFTYFSYMRQHKAYRLKKHGSFALSANSASVILEAISIYSGQIQTLNIHFSKELGQVPLKEIFPDLVRPAQFYNFNVFTELAAFIKQNNDLKYPVIIGADKGAAIFSDDAASRTGMEYGGHMDKRRDPSKPLRLQVTMTMPEIDVQGRDIVLLDDIISSGETIIKASMLLLSRGASRIFIGCVYGEFTEGVRIFSDRSVLFSAARQLQAAGQISQEQMDLLEARQSFIEKVISTDIIPNPFAMVKVGDVLRKRNFTLKELGSFISLLSDEMPVGINIEAWERRFVITRELYKVLGLQFDDPIGTFDITTEEISYSGRIRGPDGNVNYRVLKNLLPLYSRIEIRDWVRFIECHEQTHKNHPWETNENRIFAIQARNEISFLRRCFIPALNHIVNSVLSLKFLFRTPELAFAGLSNWRPPVEGSLRDNLFFIKIDSNLRRVEPVSPVEPARRAKRGKEGEPKQDKKRRGEPDKNKPGIPGTVPPVGVSELVLYDEHGRLVKHPASETGSLIDIPKGTPATLLRYMYDNNIFINTPKKSKDMAGRRGGNDSLRTIQRELRTLRLLGLIEGRGRSGYCLSGWIKGVDLERLIKEIPELDTPDLSMELIDRAREKVIQFRLMRNPWMEAFLLRYKDHERPENLLVKFLARDNPIKNDIFSEIDRLPESEILERADRYLGEWLKEQQDQFGSDGGYYSAVDSLDTRKIMLYPTMGVLDLSQVLFTSLAMNFPLSMVAKLEPGCAKEAFAFVYSILNAMAILSAKEDLVLVQRQDVEDILSYLAGKAGTLGSKEISSNLLALAGLLKPFDTVSKQESLTNLIKIIRRLEEKNREWSEVFSSPENKRAVSRLSGISLSGELADIIIDNIRSRVHEPGRELKIERELKPDYLKIIGNNQENIVFINLLTEKLNGVLQYSRIRHDKVVEEFARLLLDALSKLNAGPKREKQAFPDRVTKVPAELEIFERIDCGKVTIKDENVFEVNRQILDRLGQYQERFEKILGFISHYITGPPFETNIIIEPVQIGEPSIWHDSETNTIHFQAVLLIPSVPLKYACFVAYHDFILHAYKRLNERESTRSSRFILLSSQNLVDSFAQFQSSMAPIEIQDAMLNNLLSGKIPRELIELSRIKDLQIGNNRTGRINAYHLRRLIVVMGGDSERIEKEKDYLLRERPELGKLLSGLKKDSELADCTAAPDTFENFFSSALDDAPEARVGEFLSVVKGFKNRDFSFESLQKKVRALLNYRGGSNALIYESVYNALRNMSEALSGKKKNCGEVLGLAGQISGLYEIVVKRGTTLERISLGELESSNRIIYDHNRLAVKEFDAVSSRAVFEFKFHLTLRKLFQQVVGMDSARLSHLKVLTDFPEFDAIRNLVYFGEADDGYVVKALNVFIKDRPDILPRVSLTSSGLSVKLTLSEVREFLGSESTLEFARKEESKCRKRFFSHDFKKHRDCLERIIDRKLRKLSGEKFDVIIAVSNAPVEQLNETRVILGSSKCDEGDAAFIG
ncbi:MAG: phosphoribosyltransferase family protein, partial [Candidatus Omnitrophica bacterium]|nr:phosphoribosyltransferase family protein [Candidatus Omnitrophota bacterium]